MSLLLAMVETTARAHAGEPDTAAATPNSTEMTIEVAGARYEGEIVSCPEANSVEAAVQAVIGDLSRPPSPRAFASIRRTAPLSIAVSPPPVGKVHIDAYASSIQAGHDAAKSVFRNGKETSRRALES